MLISTKGRYALCVLTDMAEHDGDKDWISVKEIAGRQDISRKYLETIMTLLCKQGFIESSPGKGGGYKLLRQPEDYSLEEVLILTEESLAVVPCLKKDAEYCSKHASCCTIETWKQLDALISDFLGRITIKDLMRKK